MFIYGMIVGLSIGFVFNFWTFYMYKKILVSKSKDGTPENIKGSFYYIVKEKSKTNIRTKNRSYNEVKIHKGDD